MPCPDCQRKSKAAHFPFAPGVPEFDVGEFEQTGPFFQGGPAGEFEFGPDALETAIDPWAELVGEFESKPSRSPGGKTCQSYQRGEVAKSRTLRGHLPSDVIEHARGLLIADFGVDWRTPKATVKNEPLLRDWLKTTIAVVRANPSTRIRIIGLSDCVGRERNNSLLRRGRARRVYQLLARLAGRGSQWSALKKHISFVGAAPGGDYVADNATVEGRARNRGVLIESSRTVTFDADDVTVTLPDTIPRIVRRGLELIKRPDQCGLRITRYQQQRMQCILTRLSQPGVDDRYLTGQGILDFMNLRHLYPNEPYYARATQWLLPDFVVRSRKKRTDREICNTLVRIDQDIIDGRHLINRYYATHGAATPARIQRLRDWVARKQNDDRSIYSCYK